MSIIKSITNHETKSHSFKSTSKEKKYINGAEPMVAPHRLERQFDASRPNEKWFTDVTYLLFGERTLYLSTIMDAFNREIISCVISESQTLTLAMKTLKQAMRGRKVKDVLLHSDQGSIYTAKEFQAYAKENGIITSMSREEIAMIMPSWKASLVI